MSDEARKFTFAELWALAMEDADFAAGRIGADEFFRRLKSGEVNYDDPAIRALAGSKT